MTLDLNQLGKQLDDALEKETPESLSNYLKTKRTNMGKDTPATIQKELTPELAGKIWDSIQMEMLGDKLAKDGILHNLKQLKAQIGKFKKPYRGATQAVLEEVMRMIDKKIEKVSKY